MDQSFFLRAKRLLDRQRAAPSYQALLDHVAAQRAASPTSRTSPQAPAAVEHDDQSEALAALILGEPGWRVAGRIQRGCFNRAVPARPLNLV